MRDHDDLAALELAQAGSLEARRLQSLIVGAVFGVLLHLGQLEIELLHDGARFCDVLEVRAPRTLTRLTISVDVAP